MNQDVQLVLYLNDPILLLQKNPPTDLEVKLILSRIFNLVVIRTRPLLSSEKAESKGKVTCFKRGNDDRTIFLQKQEGD